MSWLKNIINRIAVNGKVLFREFKDIVGIEFTVISIWVTFFPMSNDVLLQLDTYIKKIIFIFLPFLFAAVISCIRTYLLKKRKVIDETQLSVILRYGDLWKYAFPRFSNKKRIVVVNANTAFDVLVDPPGVCKPLVSEKTLHGQWILKMNERGVSSEEINEKIQENLKEQNVSPTKILEKERGNTQIYPKGTVVQYKYNNTIFYLLALAEFDDMNNAQNTTSELSITISKLIDYIDENSQGFDVYIPLMGAGYSRTGIDEQASLGILESILKINRSKLRGKINVVVYEGSRDKISIS